jgi:RNA polymerase subunit RPABC4/transcription elongation factor Spt4
VLEQLIKAYEHYGIDPSTYDEAYQHGDTFCPVCGVHYTTMPLPRCDLELARAKDMEAEGFPARFCHHCHMAYPKATDRGAICPRCDRKQARISDEQQRRAKPRSWDALNAYVADGVGCVEKVPKWMVDFDGSPEGKPRD